jgi:hypothetical protein
MEEKPARQPVPLDYSKPDPPVSASKILLGTAAIGLFIFGLPFFLLAFSVMPAIFADRTPSRDRPYYVFTFLVLVGLGAVSSFPAIRAAFKWLRR